MNRCMDTESSLGLNVAQHVAYLDIPMYNSPVVNFVLESDSYGMFGKRNTECWQPK